ncbi:MAG: glycosyltransferase family 39 protein, partial [Candidatus Altiarchaeota archaeon]
MDKTTAIFLVILVVGATLRFYNLDSKSAWYDEVFVVEHLKKSLWDIWRGVGESGHPPFYYILSYIAGAKTIVQLRVLSALFGILSLIAFYFVIEELFGVREALLSMFMLSISHLSIQYSQMARMYSMTLFMVLLTTFILVKSLKTNSN